MSSRTQLMLWTAVLAVAVAVAGAALWWQQRPHATVRAMSVSSDVSDEQAARAAESTVRAFLAARNDRNVPNMLALSCSPDKRTSSIAYSAENPEPELGFLDAIHVGGFTRGGDFGTLPVFYRSAGSGYGGEEFTFAVEDGTLRICGSGPPKPW